MICSAYRGQPYDRFEGSLIRYPGFEQDERGVSRSTDPTKGPTIGWITDPAGNVIALIQE